MGETPFFMTYGSEAVIPVEIGWPTSWTNQFEEEENNYLLAKKLKSIEESSEVALIKLANYQYRISRGYNKGVKCKKFISSDLVLRKLLGNTRDPT